MQLPETPRDVQSLDLMQRLKAYGDGEASWRGDAHQLGDKAKTACRTLHTDLTKIATAVSPLLDRVTAKELDTFTMHDHGHALKVAHIMWHILDEERRDKLTPPEIALLVTTAYIHDLGMFLSPEVREARLKPDSDLWRELEIDDEIGQEFDKLRTAADDDSVSQALRDRARRRLNQAEEALLAKDTRERHATQERYEEILAELQAAHKESPTKIPTVDACFSFDGESFKDKLIELCVSHNQDAGQLRDKDTKNRERDRFPRLYPVGCANADLLMVAAALRMADILDFDRERTPAVLYYYLLPGGLDPVDDRSTLEWGKHMVISNWHIEPEAVVYRGRCTSHIIHHAVVKFGEQIEEEIASTRTIFGAMGDADWPFLLPQFVKTDIHEEGYKYVPYHFQLDDERIYRLLMGGAIYDEPLVAVRELVQNAVDACKLRDRQIQLYDESVSPNKEKRIYIIYEEPTEDCRHPRLTVKDSGTGMDGHIIQRYFLKVGRSYYHSAEFNATRFELRQKDLDFAPVSEFGIGFLSTMLLGDRVEVETAMWDSPHRDSQRRILEIHGPTRLIRLDEMEDAGPKRFRGTRVTITLTRGVKESEKQRPPTWEEVVNYLRSVCIMLDYPLHLQHVTSDGTEEERIDPQSPCVPVSPRLSPIVLRIPVHSEEEGFTGEIAIALPGRIRESEETLAEQTSIVIEDQAFGDDLLRGGFRVGRVPGLPGSPYGSVIAGARIVSKWEGHGNRRFPLTNVARSAAVNDAELGEAIFRNWLTHLLHNSDDLSPAGIYGLNNSLNKSKSTWLEEFDALHIFKFASKPWFYHLTHEARPPWRVDESRIEEWTHGAGSGLAFELRYGLLSHELLSIVLRHVTALKLHMSPDRSGNVQLLIAPPRVGWTEELAACRDFIKNAVERELFIEFGGELKPLLFLQGSFFLNIDYESRIVASFKPSEASALIACLHMLVQSKSDGSLVLSSDIAALFQRARDVLGDLLIGEHRKAWRIDSFSKPDVLE